MVRASRTLADTGMDALVNQRIFVLYATLGVVVVLALELLFWYRLGDISDTDARPVWLNVINIHGAIVLLLMFGAAIQRAWRSKRHKWTVFIFLVWPAAFIYAWLARTRFVNE
jgi:hypothetical protein